MGERFFSLSDLTDLYAQVHAVFGRNGISLPVEEKLAYRVFHTAFLNQGMLLEEEKCELPKRFNNPLTKPAKETTRQVIGGEQAIEIVLDCEEVLERQGLMLRYNECRNALYHALLHSLELCGITFPDIHDAFAGTVQWSDRPPRSEPSPPRENWWTLAPVSG